MSFDDGPPGSLPGGPSRPVPWPGSSPRSGSGPPASRLGRRWPPTPLPAERPRPPRRRVVEGGRHRRTATTTAGVRTSWCAAPAARPATSSTRRWTRPEVRERLPEVRMEELAARRRRSSATTRSSCSATGTPACPTAPRTPTPRCFARAPARRGRRAAGRDHPAGATRRCAHLRRRPDAATRTPTTCGCTRSPWRPSPPRPTPTAYPETGRALAGGQGLLLGLVPQAASRPPTPPSGAGPRVALRRGWFARESQDHRITTSDRRRRTLRRPQSAALRAHATQIDPTSPFWFGLPEDVAASDPPLRGLHPGAVATVEPRSPRPTSSPVSTEPLPRADQPQPARWSSRRGR